MAGTGAAHVAWDLKKYDVLTPKKEVKRSELIFSTRLRGNMMMTQKKDMATRRRPSLPSSVHSPKASVASQAGR